MGKLRECHWCDQAAKDGDVQLLRRLCLLPFQHARFDAGSCRADTPMWYKKKTVALSSTAHRELNPSELGGVFPKHSDENAALANLLTPAS